MLTALSYSIPYGMQMDHFSSPMLRFIEVSAIFWTIFDDFCLYLVNFFPWRVKKTLIFVLNYCAIYMLSISSNKKPMGMIGGVWLCLLWANSMILERSIEYFDLFWPILANFGHSTKAKGAKFPDYYNGERIWTTKSYLKSYPVLFRCIPVYKFTLL